MRIKERIESANLTKCDRVFNVWDHRIDEETRVEFLEERPRSEKARINEADAIQRKREITKIGCDVWFLSHNHLEDSAPVIQRFLCREREIEKLRKSKGGKKDELPDHMVGDQFRNRVEAICRNKRNMRDCEEKLQKQATRLFVCLDNDDVNKMLVEIERITAVQFED